MTPNDDDGRKRGRLAQLAVTVSLAALLAVAAVVVLAYVVGGDEDAAVPTATAGQRVSDARPLTERPPPDRDAPLPRFELPAFDGDAAVTAADYAGEPLVLNFWATWCAPCVEEMPALQQAADEAGDEVAYLGVNVTDLHDHAVALVEELGIRYDLAVDADGAFAEQVGVFGMPTTLFVDGTGTIRYRHTGPLTIGQIRELSATHLRGR